MDLPSGGEPTRGRGFAGPMFLAAGLIAAVAVSLLLCPRPPGEPQGEARPPGAAESQPDGAGAGAPASEPGGAISSAEARELPVPVSEKVAPGGSVWVERDSWDAQAPPVLLLDVGAPQTAAGPLAAVVSALQPARLVARIETAPVALGAHEARLRLPAEALEPGRYLIQVKTTERTPLPLRRYVLEVR